MSYVFPPRELPSVHVQGLSKRFAVHRIYCVGRNYAEHAREMGSDPNREAPFFFSKPADAVVGNQASVPVPSRTQNFHHEVELVVALGKGGANIAAANALDCVFGYAVGNDLTRRDLQKQAKDAGKPWDISKGFDYSAPVAAIRPLTAGGHVTRGKIWLKINGELKQQGDVADLIWKVPEIIAELSTFYELQTGDLIFTGTPAGVSALKKGDRVEAGIEGLETLVTTIV
jgi:fumarylpyruvate hydrolase